MGEVPGFFLNFPPLTHLEQGWVGPDSQTLFLGQILSHQVNNLSEVAALLVSVMDLLSALSLPGQALKKEDILPLSSLHLIPPVSILICPQSTETTGVGGVLSLFFL